MTPEEIYLQGKPDFTVTETVVFDEDQFDHLRDRVYITFLRQAVKRWPRKSKKAFFKAVAGKALGVFERRRLRSKFLVSAQAVGRTA